MKTEKQEIWKALKNLDAEIRTIKKEKDADNKDVYIVEVGLYESLGEQGEILTLVYHEFPEEGIIIEEVINSLRASKDDLNNSILSETEERYLEVLNKLKL